FGFTRSSECSGMGEVEVGVVEPIASRVGLRRWRTEDVAQGQLVPAVLDPQGVPSDQRPLEDNLDRDESALQLGRRPAKATVEIECKLCVIGPCSEEDFLE